ncbi:MAG: VWA domain-containing protein [Planctomycetota bacterium]
MIGPIQFASPLWLVLVPLLWFAAWWFSRRSLSGLGSATRYVSLAVRFVVIAGLVAALAEPSVRREGEGLGVIVVVDGSSSMPQGAVDSVVESLGGMIEGAGPDDRLGIVTTAEQAFARSLPTKGVTPERALAGARRAGDFDPGARDGTNLADALNTAISVLPADAASRIVLISDGNETAGNAQRAAERAKALGVPVDVIPVEPTATTEIVFDELNAPAAVRLGQTANLTAVLRTNVPGGTTGRLSLSVDGRPYDFTPGEEGTSMPVTLREGQTPFTIPVTLLRGGPQRFVARFEPDEPGEDVIAQNNIAGGVTFVQGEGKVLVYTVDPFATEPFLNALLESDIDARLLTPGEGPRTLEAYQEYDAVVLFDTPASSFDSRQQEQLAQYVRDSGGGLLMVGGPNGFGAGGWISSPVEEVLPVRLDVPERRNMPKGAMAIIVDTSGSMASPISGTSLSALDAAEEGAIAAVTALSRLDLATVLRFDTGVGTVVPLQEVGDKGAFIRKIRALAPGGGTSMYPAIRQGLDVLENADAGVKHIVVLSDGETIDDGSRNQLVSRANRLNISISTVSIGGWANDPLLQALTAQTGGLYHKVNATAAGLAELPQIFVKEAQIVKRALIWEGDPFNPIMTGAPSVPLRSIPSPAPAITGYVVTTDREGLSVVTMRAPEPDEDPILAHWQHGLGRTVAFTPDATTRWGADWVSWGAFRSFWEQHVRWAMRPTGSANLTVVTTNDGPRTKVTVNALDDTGEPLNFARFVARVIAPDMTARDLSLPQAAPGRYEGWFDSSESGSYLITTAYETQAVGDESVQERGTIQASVTRPFADEFRRIVPNTGLMRRVAEITGGRVLSDPEHAGAALFESAGLEQPVALRPVWLAFILACVGLFLADVAVRRVRISPRAILASAKRAVKRSQLQQPAQVESLRAARDKTRTRLTAQSTETKQAARVKFEADPKAAPVQTPIVTARPPAETVRAGSDSDAPKKPEQDEGDGMSRLLAAKKRAQAQQNQD